MAVYNEILSGRFNRALQKITGIKGSPPVRTLGSEILPVFPLFWGVENRYLEGWDRFGSDIFQPAVAAQAGQIRYRNPAGSNVIAVVEKCAYSSFSISDNISFVIGPQTSDLATGVALTANRFDPRGRPQPTLLASRTTQVALLNSVQMQFYIPANSTYDMITYENQELTILPGDALTIGSETVNQGVLHTLWWRERFLEDSERF